MKLKYSCAYDVGGAITIDSVLAVLVEAPHARPRWGPAYREEGRQTVHPEVA